MPNQDLNEILILAETEASPMGLTVVDTKLSQQGKRRILEITICRKGGRIALSDCEELSRKLDKLFDEQVPPILDGSSYMLEVQSPGLDRQLKNEREFEIFAGEEIEVKIKDPQPGLGDFITGKLHSLQNGKLKVDNPKPVITKGNAPKKNKPKPTVELPESVELDFNRVSTVRLSPAELQIEADSDQEIPVELD